MMCVKRSAQRRLDAVEGKLFQGEGSLSGSNDAGPWKMETPETSLF